MQKSIALENTSIIEPENKNLDKVTSTASLVVNDSDSITIIFKIQNNTIYELRLPIAKTGLTQSWENKGVHYNIEYIKIEHKKSQNTSTLYSKHIKMGRSISY